MLKIDAKSIEEIKDIANSLVRSVRGPIDGPTLLLAAFERWLIKTQGSVSFEVSIEDAETYHETIGED